jgi:hypothetical protein
MWDDDALKNEGFLAVLTTPLPQARRTRGKINPYMGSKTREKRSEHGYKIISTDTTSQAFRKLQLILSQSGGDAAFSKIIDVIGLSRSNTVLSEISSLLPTVTGGTIAHRYAARTEESSAYLIGSPTVSSHCLISTDNCGKVSGGLEDYEIMMQEHELTALWCLSQFSSESGDKRRACLLVPDFHALDPIPDKVLKITRDCFIPLKRYTHNRLAFLPEIIVDRSLPDVHMRGIGITKTAKLDPQPSTQTVVDITLGWFMWKLRESNLARAVADSSHDLFPQDQLDIAEVMGAGQSTLIKCAAMCLSDSLIADTSRAVSREVSRWNSGVYLRKVGRCLAQMFVRQLSHPKVQALAKAHEQRVVNYPKYYPLEYGATTRVTNAIVTMAHRFLTEPEEGYMTRPLPMFSIGSTYQVSELKYLSAVKILYFLQVTGELHPEDVSRITKKYLLPPIRRTATDQEKTVGLNYGLREVVAQLQHHQKWYAAELVNRIQRGTGITVYSMTAADAIRLLRVKALNVGSFKAPIPRETLRGLSNRTNKLVVQPSEEVPQEEEEPHITPGWVSGRALEGIHRAIGTASNRFGPSSVLWESQARFFPTTTVLVVGAGVGNVAALAVACGADHVWGMDLTEDLPQTPHRFTSYRPARIIELGMEDKYDQVPNNMIIDGDWYSKTSRNALMRFSMGQTVLIIDIEAGTQPDLYSTLFPLGECLAADIIMWKCQLRISEWCRIGATLSENKMEYTIRYLQRTQNDLIALLVLRNTGLVPHPTNTKYQVLGVSPSRSHESDLKDNSQYTNTLLLSVLGFVDVEGLNDHGERLYYLATEYKAEVGDYYSRPGHTDWTSLMIAILGTWWLTLDPPEKVQTVLLWAQGKPIEVEIWGCLVRLSETSRLIRHISKICARLVQPAERGEIEVAIKKLIM